MSMHGNIGFTRRDKTPVHWKEDYKLTPKTKKLIQELHAEREKLFKELENLPSELSDDDYSKAEKSIIEQIDKIPDREDELRKLNSK